MKPSETKDGASPASKKTYRGKKGPGLLQKVGLFFRESEWFWACAFLVIVFAVFATHFRVKPPQALPLGSAVTKDIRAPYDLQIVDQVATSKKRAEAQDKILPVYDWDSGLQEDLKAQVAEAFSTARSILDEYRRKRRAGQDRASRSADETRLNNALSEACGGVLSNFTIRQFRREGCSEALEQAIKDILGKVEKRKIVSSGETFQGYPAIHIRDIRKEGSGWDQPDPRHADIISLVQARRLPGSLVDERLPKGSGQLRGAVEEYVRSLLKPNLTFNSKETKLQRDEAADQVEPLVVFLKKGQVIVKAGEKVDEGVLQKIDGYRASNRNVINTPLLGALFIFLLLLLTFTFVYLKSYRKAAHPGLNLFVLTLQVASTFMLIAQGLIVLLRLIVEGSKASWLENPHSLVFIIPVAAGALLMTLLADRHVAVIYTLLFSVLFGILMDFNFGMFLFAILSCCMGIYAGEKMAQRLTQWKAGLLVGLVNIPLAAGILFIDPSWHDLGVREIVAPLSMAFLAGFPLTVMIAASFLPFFESAFGILTEVRLLELSNMNHPLLKRLALEAPGTYNHSLMMAALSESAANAVGANGLFCRVACYYHDIGKMLNPLYFVENQTPGINPHDKILPRMSSLIISAHVKEGIAMGRQFKLPQAIVDIIPQHHGSRRISYFMDKALTMADPTKEILHEADFSYPGPKPKTREAAIIMMADGIEAGSRVLRDPSHQRVKTLVNEIVDRIVSEDQLDESDLTFKDLAVVRDSFVNFLTGLFSRRISYPGFTFDKEQNDGSPGGQTPLPAEKSAHS